MRHVNLTTEGSAKGKSIILSIVLHSIACIVKTEISEFY